MLDLVWFLLIGLAAGYLAGRIMKSNRGGLLGNLLIGVIGAMLGGILFRLIGLRSTGLVGSLVTATTGAVVLIAGLRQYNKSSSKITRL